MICNVSFIYVSNAIEAGQESNEPGQIFVKFLCEGNSGHLMIFPEESQHAIYKRSGRFNAFVNIEEFPQ